MHVRGYSQFSMSEKFNAYVLGCFSAQLIKWLKERADMLKIGLWYIDILRVSCYYEFRKDATDRRLAFMIS